MAFSYDYYFISHLPLFITTAHDKAVGDIMRLIFKMQHLK